MASNKATAAKPPTQTRVSVSYSLLIDTTDHNDAHKIAADTIPQVGMDIESVNHLINQVSNICIRTSVPSSYDDD